MKTLFFLASFLGLTALLQAQTVKVGDQAPAVVGLAETGAKLDFTDLYKKQTYTLVYFYPKAFTKGCTDQGCSLRDGYEALTKQGVAVIGVSIDTVEDQKRFKEENRLPFTLIADMDKAVTTAFGVPNARVAQRSAYLIKDGKVVYTDYKGTTTEQAAVILKFIAEQK